MLYYLGLSLLGLVIGGFGTLIGVGGGLILMPVLLLLYPRANPDSLTSISLAVSFINALSGAAAYARLKRIHYRSGLLFAAAAIPGAVLGALGTYCVNRPVFNLLFAVLLLGLAVYLFINPPRRDDIAGNDLQAWQPRRLPLGIALSFIVGFVSSFMGIGGGIIHVPAMITLLYFPVHIATATSLFILAIVTFAGTAVHFSTGTLQQGLDQVVALAVGVILGSQISARLSHRVHGTLIIRLLAGALALAGLRMILTAL